MGNALTSGQAADPERLPFWPDAGNYATREKTMF